MRFHAVKFLPKYVKTITLFIIKEYNVTFASNFRTDDKLSVYL